jgi:glyceraldehyde 3-phosphate dehydrogenase
MKKGNAMTKVAINGFGRIGRLVARAILERPDCGLELVAINDLADAKSNAMLFKRDSVHGSSRARSSRGDAMIVNGKRIQVTAERDPAKLPHRQLASTSRWNAPASSPTAKAAEASRRRRQARADLGPGQGRRPDRRLRRQHDKLTAEHTIVSNASCTTNCLAPVPRC